jgi:hypothetical protein
MLLKFKKTWKDLAENSNHHGLTRRDFLARGLATGAMSVALPQIVANGFLSQAQAATMSCPPPARKLGSIAQIYAEGGPTMGARFISDEQAAMMSAGMAANYGISGQANLVKLGPNMVVDKTSPFGFALMQGPPGYPGGAAAWQTNVLNKISGGGHLGPFNADDGAGSDSGLIGGVSPFKESQMGKDLMINTSRTPAAWANGLPAATVRGGGNLSPTSLASVFSLTPAATGLTTGETWAASSDAANSLAKSFSGIFGNDKRKGGQQMMESAGCAFYGNSALADPNYGATLFNPANIAALNTKMTVNNLSNQEKAQVAAFYQSAAGVAGGVIMQFNGRDYHGASPQNVIAPADIEEARAIVMWLAACEAAQAPGAMIYLSNGQAIADGVQNVNVTLNGANVNVNAAIARGDGGGAYNAGLIIFYDPKGSPPAAKFTGTVNSTTGNAKTDGNVGSSKEAVAGLYLSALQWINGGTIPQSAIAKMQAAGVAGTPSKVLVI